MADEKVIHVQGHGEVQMTPDIAVVNLGVVSRESEARAAMQAAADKMHAIIAAVREQGVPDRDIQTTQFNLFHDQQANVYMASHQITIRAEDVARVGAILDAAVEAGANASAGVQFALSDTTEPENRALELAVADARRRADIVVGALGITIAGVDRVSVTQGGAIHPGPVFRRQAAHAAAQPTPVEAGQLTVAADVQVTYRFE